MLSQHQVQAWSFQDLLLECYRYALGPPEVSPRHSHPEYQFCLSLDFPGVYDYRGASHPVPAGSLSILHPGEAHGSYDPEERLAPTHYRLMYLPPRFLQEAVRYCGATVPSEPFFPIPILQNEDLFHRFLHLHSLLGSAATLLEQETFLQSLLTHLVVRYTERPRDLPFSRREKAYVRRLRDYLTENCIQDISLTQLAEWVGLNPYYLNQAFRQAVGVPPHLYQTQMRIEKAKRLLAGGLPIAQTAREVGFYDQSHFGKHFRRLVGVTPARYQTLKSSYPPPVHSA